MISVNINDKYLRKTAERLLSLCSLNSGDILICDEANAAEIAENSHSGVIVLYTNGTYLYSDTHSRLASAYGERYRSVSVPLDYREFCEVVTALYQSAVVATSPAMSTARDTVSVSEETCTVKRGTCEVQLTEREMQLFIYLRAHCGKVVSRDTLKNEVWGNTTDEGTNIVDVYISYLRRKLKPVLGEGAIISVRGQGYMIPPPRE